jgi:hypothetical protein
VNNILLNGFYYARSFLFIFHRFLSSPPTFCRRLHTFGGIHKHKNRFVGFGHSNAANEEKHFASRQLLLSFHRPITDHSFLALQWHHYLSFYLSSSASTSNHFSLLMLAPNVLLFLLSFQVAWMHFEQSAILTVHNHVITRNPRISVTHDKHDKYKTWFLHIANVQEEDKGRYMCQINTVTAKTQFGYVHVVGKDKKNLQTHLN